MMEKNEKGTNRRELIAVGSAFGLLGVAAVASGGAIFKYLFPVVSYGTPQKFQVPIEDLPEIGDELVFDDQKVILRRKSKEEIGAISLVCTHLGCTVNRVATGFLCPCHGSQYDEDGIVVGGPAPKTLHWLSVKTLPGNVIEVDRGSDLAENSYFKV